MGYNIFLDCRLMELKRTEAKVSAKIKKIPDSDFETFRFLAPLFFIVRFAKLEVAVASDIALTFY
jgi:hypothetical protein